VNLNISKSDYLVLMIGWTIVRAITAIGPDEETFSDKWWGGVGMLIMIAAAQFFRRLSQQKETTR